MQRKGKLEFNPHNFDIQVQPFELITRRLQLLLPDEMDVIASKQSESSSSPHLVVDCLAGHKNTTNLCCCCYCCCCWWW